MNEFDRVKVLLENFKSFKNIVDTSGDFKGLPASAAVILCSHMMRLECDIRKLEKILSVSSPLQ